MLRLTWFLVFVVGMLVATRAEAQDGGVQTPPSSPHPSDPMWECLRVCMDQHPGCVDANILLQCYGSPACHDLWQDASLQHQTLERYCGMCAYRGNPANNCPAPGGVAGTAQAPVSSPTGAFTPNPVMTANASPSQMATPSSSSSPPPAAPPPGPPHRVRPRPLPPDVCRDHHPRLAFNSSECLCLRENAIWVRDYSFTNQNGDRVTDDTCLSSAFAALEGRVDNHETRITTLEQRPSGVTEGRVNELVEAAAVQDRNRYDVQIIGVQDLVAGLKRQLNHHTNSVHGSHGASAFGFRFGPYLGLNSHQVSGAVDGLAVTPFVAGLELSWMPSFATGWYAELGFGAGYAGPRMFGREHLHAVVHGGFLWRPSGPLALGFGAQFMERTTMQLQGVGAFFGAYVEPMIHTTQPGFFAFVSVRLAPGADITAVATDNARFDFAFVATFHLGIGYF